MAGDKGRLEPPFEEYGVEDLRAEVVELGLVAPDAPRVLKADMCNMLAVRYAADNPESELATRIQSPPPDQTHSPPEQGETKKVKVKRYYPFNPKAEAVRCGRDVVTKHGVERVDGINTHLDGFVNEYNGLLRLVEVDKEVPAE